VRRIQDYESILESAGQMQASIAKLLSAKAGEARLNQSWISVQLRPGEYAGPGDVHSVALEMHDQMIEILDGITKLEIGLARGLKALLNREEESPSGMGDMFGTGGRTPS